MNRVLPPFKLLLLIALAALVPKARAQSMLESLRAGWSTYVFVSTSMPRTAIVDLARESSRAHATLVFRGFPQADGAAGRPVDFQALELFVARINAECCKGSNASWMVDPRLYDRYGVRAVPSFVVAWGESAKPQDFSRVDGDMALANALKFFAQQSAIPGIRSRAADVYSSAFGGHS